MADIGTGDGRFVSSSARQNPNKFYIGIDANVEPLKKPSMKTTRKPAKGGLPNALFVQAAVEDLPEELDGIANEIHINFPWGSLLRGVAATHKEFLKNLRRLMSDCGRLTIVIGFDPERDKTEIERLGIPGLDESFIPNGLVQEYRTGGFQLASGRLLTTTEWRALETTWAKKLLSGAGRKVIELVFQAT